MSLQLFHPVVAEWFRQQLGQPSLPQAEGWPAISRGENVLITAPTGAGKTLAAFLVAINDLLQQGWQGDLREEVQVLYVSPLKALNNDIYRNLEVPLQGIEAICRERRIAWPPITRAVRTGDTPAKERQQMLRRPPHILITTPESLYLLLTSPKAHQLLRYVRYLILDEIHALLDSKRGAHLSLSLERLEQLTLRPLQRIGLSATVSPLADAALFLGGGTWGESGWQPRPVAIVSPAMPKLIDLAVQMPVADYRTLSEGSVWPSIYRQVVQLVKQHRSTIVFVNNRAVAEKVAFNVNLLAGESIARAHHGSVSRLLRLDIEQQLKSGQLPCLVATATLELGIDIGAVDLMVQIAAPKSVARGLQRLGRAGHRLDAVSVGRIIPRTRGDLLESVCIAREMLNGSLESVQIPENCLDVLAQQIVAMASVREWGFAELLRVVRGAYAYRQLPEDELEQVLCMLAGDYEHQQDLPVRPRLIWDRVNRQIRGDNYSRLLALGSAGTIPDRGYFPVYLMDSPTRLGELDEGFVFESRTGDRFMLGTSAWRIERIEKDRVIVSQSGTGGARTPYWTGEGLGRPFDLGVRFGAFLRELSERVDQPDGTSWLLSEAPVSELEAKALGQYVLEQKQALGGTLAHDRQLVVEYFADEVGDHRVVIHSPFGGRVNSGLAMLFEHLVAKAWDCQVEAKHNDDGVLLNIMGMDDHLRRLFDLLAADRAEELLLWLVPGTPMFSIAFRYNVARALMIGTRQHGKRSPLWIQRMRALEALQLAEQHRDHPLIVETYRECLESILDVPSLLELLRRVERGEIAVCERVTERPSPFGSELLFQFSWLPMYEGLLPDPRRPAKPAISHQQQVRLTHHLRRAPQTELELWAALQAEKQDLQPWPLEYLPGSADELHNQLITFGALSVSRLAVLVHRMEITFLLNELVDQGRVATHALPAGTTLWLATEDQALFRAALTLAAGDESQAARQRLLRRFARYHSPFTLGDVEFRFGSDAAAWRGTIHDLEQNEWLVPVHAGGAEMTWCHSVVWRQAERRSRRSARERVATQPISVWAAFLPSWQGAGAPGTARVDRLLEVIKQLAGLPLPVEWWEDFVFPSRVPGYRPQQLDQLCSTGQVVWHVQPGASGRISWYPVEQSTGDLPVRPFDQLPPVEEQVYQTLASRGASWLQQLATTTQLESQVLLGALSKLLWQGLITNDSFAAIRYFLAPTGAASVKATASRRAAAYRPEMGRFAVAVAPVSQSVPQQLERWFSRYGLLMYEVFQAEETDCRWAAVYDQLEQWELIGRAERGYYVEGLSGRQFALPKAAAGLQAQLQQADWRVLIACDPAQVYGKLAPYPQDLQWTRVPGTAVVSLSGRVLLVAERYGARIAFPAQLAPEQQLAAFQHFLQAWEAKQFWVSRRKLVMNSWQSQPAAQSELTMELQKLGFLREMQDLVKWRTI